MTKSIQEPNLKQSRNGAITKAGPISPKPEPSRPRASEGVKKSLYWNK